MNYPLLPLGEVASPVERLVMPVKGQKYRQIGVKLWGNGAYERETIDGEETKYKTLSRVEANDIIVNKIWARNGSVAVIPEHLAGCYGSSEFPTFIPNQVKLCPRWVHWLTKTKQFWHQCDVKSSGTSGQNRIRPERFLEINIPLPSLSEQKRVIARIEELVLKIGEAQGLQRKSQTEAELLVGAEVFAIFEQGKKEWLQGKLGDYVIDDCYGTSDKTDDDESGTPILRMGNIQNGRLNLRDLKYLRLSEKERNKLLLKKDDIIVNRTNSAELVGKCAVFDIEGDYGFASYLIRLRLDTKRAEPHLVAAYINSPAGRAYMFNERKQMTGQANVNATKLKNLPIALPQVDEQHHILKHITGLQRKVDELKNTQLQTAAELDAMLPSILDRAFNGEL
jgi:type I restriction enzyme S subunit